MKVAIAALAALCFVGTASAHYGDVWFQTKASMQDNITSKYAVTQGTSCRPAPWAHWTRDNDFGAKRYDHFICGVKSQITGRICVAVAHQTGSRWSDIVLTGYHYANGTTCVPADLRRRRG